MERNQREIGTIKRHSTEPTKKVVYTTCPRVGTIEIEASERERTLAEHTSKKIASNPGLLQSRIQREENIQKRKERDRQSIQNAPTRAKKTPKEKQR